MLKNKLFNMSLIILIGITLLGAMAFVLWKTTFAASEEPEVIQEKKLSADEVVAQTVTTDLITTNLLSDKDYIVIQFGILLDSIEAKEEFEKRTVEVKSIIISVLADQTPEDLKGAEGIDKLNAKLMNRFNEILLEGKVKRVDTIDRKLQ